MDLLCPLDHFYVSQVKLSNFLYPLSIMTKKGRNCGDFVVSFLRFYMLGGEIHAFVKEDVFHLVRGSAYFLLLVHQSCDHVYIHCAYLWWCMSSSPILTCVVSFLSLYTCFYLYAIYYFCFTQRCLDVFSLKCFRNIGYQSLLVINSLLAKLFKSLC